MFTRIQFLIDKILSWVERAKGGNIACKRNKWNIYKKYDIVLIKIIDKTKK
jgi:hypothetical protein